MSVVRIISSCLVAFLLSGGAEAATIHVEADGSGDYATIAAAVEAAAWDDTIELGPGLYTGPDNRAIMVYKSLLFVAPEGATIDCGGVARAFSIEACGAAFVNLTIRNGLDEFGGAIHLFDGAGIEMVDCVLTDNAADSHGGAIYGELDCGVSIERTVFARNRAAAYGGAVYLTGSSYGTITSSTMSMNRAGVGGSVTYLESDASLYFANNIIAFNQGTPPCSDYYSANYTVSCTNVYGNEGGDWVYSIAGMSGVAGNVSVDPLFCDPMAEPMNLAPSAGSPMNDPSGCGLYGAVDADLQWFVPVYGVSPDGRGQFATIQDAVDGAQYGAIVKLEDGVYTGAGNYGVEFPDKEITLTSRSGVEENCIIDCDAVEGVVETSAFWFLEPTSNEIAITDLTVRNGYSFAFGGGMTIMRATYVRIQRCNFENNVSATGGGAVRIQGAAGANSSISITNCTFNGNRGDNGGAIDGINWNGQCNTNVFDGNEAGDGGAVAIESSNVTINTCTFSANTATRSGGAVFANSGSATIVFGEFVGNTARFGGAVCGVEADIELRTLHFEDNYAIEDGGAVAVAPTTLYVDVLASDNRFVGNRAGGAGSVFHVGDEVNFTLSASTLHGNLTYDPDPLTASQLWFGNNNAINISTTLITDGVVGIPFMLGGTGNSYWFGSNNVWNNDAGDYVGYLEGLRYINYNESADPLYCDAPAGDFTVRSDSPCLPDNNPAGISIGAEGEGCQALSGVGTPVVAGGPRLLQNSPNPFNPSTEIAFTLDRAGPVRLVVYDARGREVARLVDGELASGTHVRTFGGRGLASGVYLYRLSTPEGTLARRMTLLK